MKSIDFKSLLIGNLGTALVMVQMGRTTHNVGFTRNHVSTDWYNFDQANSFWFWSPNDQRV